MFTGIITDIGRLMAVSRVAAEQKASGDPIWRGDTRFEVACRYDPDTIDIGASIALSGACMTVIEKTRTDEGCIFAVEVSDESLDKTMLYGWAEGQRINLERAMKVGDEFGGHMVSGHVDARGQLISMSQSAGSITARFRAPSELLFAIAPKGSITIDGVSLTVNLVEGDEFTVNLIPHTAEVTTLGQLRAGDEINLEIDSFARYVARYIDHMKARGDV